MVAASASSSRVTSDSGTALGSPLPAAKISIDIRFGSLRATLAVPACIASPSATSWPSACASPLGSTIMITDPSPMIVVPENMRMSLSIPAIGLTTISSVWNTSSTTMPNECGPTCATTTNVSGSAPVPSPGLMPSSSASRTTGNSVSRRRSTSAFFSFSIRFGVAGSAFTSSVTASCGMAKRSPAASTISAGMIASVSGILSSPWCPCPLCS